MNYKIVIYYLGQIIKTVSLFMLLPIIVALCYGEYGCIFPFALAVALGLMIGFFCTLFIKIKDKKLGNKEALVIVGLSWVVISAVGAIPFSVSGCIPNYIDALFETVSGFTTTGVTVWEDVSSVPTSMLFWRVFTQWLGGMGILVFMLAIMPSTDGTTYYLFKFESPGPQAGKIVSKVRHTAAILYFIYFIFTVFETVMLLFGGVSFFDSLMIAMSTAGTSGFTGFSLAKYDGLYVDAVIAVFMFLFGINFNIFYLCVLKHFKSAFADEELRFYLIYTLGCILIVALNLLSVLGNVAEALRYSSFTVISIISSTGFTLIDISAFPQLSQTLFFLMMAIGSCAGSTGGGIKISRILILVRSCYAHILTVLSPHSVQLVKLNKKTLSKEVVSGVEKYMVVYVLLFVSAMILLSIEGVDFFTNFSSVLACLSNVGLGMGETSASFAFFSPFGKILLSFIMLVGRLEIFPMLLLFVPKTWSGQY